jgi:3-carboxy-cis,cis-muconate cycloisomerase
MSDEAPRAGLFDGMFARGPVAIEVGDAALLRQMLRVEAALARAEARAGLMAEEHAEAIGRACRPEAFDLGELARAIPATGTPVVALVEGIRKAVGGPAANDVHRGATSQDIVDTATMLVASRAIGALLLDLDAAADAAAGLAETHRGTLMAARTLLQQAAPTTFGAKAAGWLIGLDTVAERLIVIRGERLAVQLGGPAGTLAALGADGPAVVRYLAEELELLEPLAPWHTERTRIADLAGALGTTAAAVAKPALDLVLLAQTEVGEVTDSTPGRGGSSALPHKRNPIAAISARACAAQAPGLVATLLTVAGGSEHERGAGAWHAEWRPLIELFRTVGSATAWLRDALQHLEVDPARMLANLELTGLLDPAGSVGSAGLFVDRAVAAHAAHVARRGLSR